MLLLIHLKKLDYICKHSYLESGVDTEAPGCWIHTGYILSVVYFFKGQFLSVKPTHREECGVNTLQAFALWHQPCLSKKATCYHYLTLNNKHPKMSQGTRGRSVYQMVAPVITLFLIYHSCLLQHSQTKMNKFLN